MSYIKGLNERCKNICRKYGIQMHFKVGRTIKDLLVKPNGRDTILQKSRVIYMSQAQKLGYRIQQDGSCIAARVGRVGTLTDVQAGQHDFAVHAQGFSCLKREADNCDIIGWHHCHYVYVGGWELYKESTHEPWGSCLGFCLHHI